jgi:ankyrin repeat protein
MDAGGDKRDVSVVLTALGIIPTAGAVLYAGRIVYESTFLTWQQGPQMVGFAMVHNDAAILVLLALLLSLIWVIAVVLVAAYRRTWVSTSQMLLIAVVALSFGLPCVPYGDWKLFTMKICGTERVTPDWLTAAAAGGEKRLLQHLIASGFDINTRNSGGETLLTIAKRTGRSDVAAWLAAHGAREAPLN